MPLNFGLQRKENQAKKANIIAIILYKTMPFYRIFEEEKMI
jgi:hypothetical protein